MQDSAVQLHALELRLGQLEKAVQRLHDEVEACSVLVLQADAAASSDGGIFQTEETPAKDDVNHISSRLDVLEDAWAMRSATVAKSVDAHIAQLEGELLEVWKAIRTHDARLQELPSELADKGSRIQELADRVARLQTDVSSEGDIEFQRFKPVLDVVMHEVDKSMQTLGQRCDQLEVNLDKFGTSMIGLRTDEERSRQLQGVVEMLVQQCSEDSQANSKHFAEVDARLRSLGDDAQRESNWVAEANALRTELDDLRCTKMPSVFQQSMRTTKVVAEGLQALREDVLQLHDKIQRKPLCPPEPCPAIDAAGLLSLRAEVADLRQQLSHTICVDLEERLAILRADFIAEAATAAREAKEGHEEAARRFALLEPWTAQQASLQAELRAVQLEFEQDRTRLDVLTRDTRSLELRLANLRQPDNLALPDAPSAPHLPILPGPTPTASTPVPIVLGKRIVWTLSPALLRVTQGPGACTFLISQEFEASGFRWQLKFFPYGSPSRKQAGYCSLYLQALMPVIVKFRLFARTHVSQLLEAIVHEVTTGPKRDLGRHDFCPLLEQLDEDGSITVGAELVSADASKVGQS
mmetsp:Transcript_29019/g.56040  ORF Transcript_29019/g.56040 Transcript_29019/m.56040 type:complete len:581 (+) Transcript_29019:134-1876(+)